ncbi:MAG: cytochrome c oxidase accessory protein CcoG [Flavobacteriales bacterium]|nr:cytochrome c oxidase accessory protein CcoG [Flavobacteriales bacterium]MCB9447286.1 cytochrome c oxidase accessory protein CcoG [Flavobacteriales bacterium]
MSTSHTSESTSYRDKLSTVDEKGRRIWIYPKKVTGKFYNLRTYVSWFLLAFLFAGPFLKIKGEPFLMFNVLERKFVLFGQVFWPQDFHLFVLAFIILIVFVVLFTVAFGRLFCGWVCPQTLFMEMVFRKIEYWIDGDWKQQKELDNAPWTAAKIRKRILKHSVFFLIAFIISNTFLAYIIGIGQLEKIITDPPSEHVGGLTSMMVFSGAFYFVFAFFREQVCTNVCPYGRFQGVMLDRNSIVVTYDYHRGEPRGMIRKKEDQREKGDCVDCHECVRVCPTGIDIRNGTQLECVNCTACIDACNHVMEKIKKPKGLIRYASESEIADRVKFTFTNRLKGYTAVLSLLIVAMVALLVTRSDVETTLLRIPGLTFQKMDDGRISNMYNFKVLNKTGQDLPLAFRITSGPGEIKIIGNPVEVEPHGMKEGELLIMLDKEELHDFNVKVTVGVYHNEELIETIKTSFLGPIKTY